MKSRVYSLLFAGDRQFVTLRGFSMLAALTFALIYSKQLGVERRGLLTFVMMTNLVFSILLISGISLHLRNIARKEESREALGTYVSVVLVFSFMTPLLNLAVLNIYQEITGTNIPNNLLYVCVLYCFFSTLSYGMHDALLLIKSIKIASVMDIGVVLLQIAGYLTLVYSGETSYFVSVLISISISYLVMVSSTLLLIIYIYNPKISLSWTSLKRLLIDSSTPTLVNMTNQLLERLDKVFIGLQTSAVDLGRFSTSQSLLGISRFIFDALAKLTIARDRNFLAWKKSKLLMSTVVGLLTFFVSVIASQFINVFLGPEWKLPFLMILSLGFIEILRGIYSLVIMNSLRSDNYLKLKKVTLVQLLVGLVVQPLVVHFYSLWGSIVCSSVILFIGIYFLRNDRRE
jgi:O-antigen/teichoic acid export membrane protein